MFSCRGDNLYGDILRNQFLLDQCADKLKFCFGCCRKTDFNLLKSQFAKKLKKIQLFFQTHRDNQRLISVPKVNAAPAGSFGDVFL